MSDIANRQGYYSSKVPRQYHGFAILDYLESRFRYFSRTDWHALLADRAVLVNEVAVSESRLLVCGDVVSCRLPPVAEPPADCRYQVLFEDEFFLAVNKSGNLLVHRSGAAITSNLSYHLRYRHEPPLPEARIVNRLDRNTSGIVLVAKGKEAFKPLAALFKQQQIHKEYVAVLEGRWRLDHYGIIRLPVGAARYSRLKSRQAVAEKAIVPKIAATRYAVAGFLGFDRTLMRLFPLSGRTHQLRVHMAAMGHPVCGDRLYQLSDDDYISWRRDTTAFDEFFPLERQALHCRRLAFVHPWTGRLVSVTAPLPADLQAFIKQEKSST